ncbi:cytochrome P450 [Aspergillus violaceofuscus CBS 115571]|uniref:Cytochrome P450 n=1 Tax=Aspergillus violaceofuscus (strain CBS 115571) TaxID=1450538 RepID=A0A2V5ILT0_ASPV1|nr:cytochrome P450 [Aspergillus violaceofuscus CBS 115571]
MMSMILAWADTHPGIKTFGTIVVCLAVSFYIIQELLKPVGKRRGPGGKRYKLPPGPKGVPILGSLPLLKNRARDDDHKAVTEMAQYGEMTTLHLGTKTWILLNSKRVVAEIIAKRGSLTNGRSPMPISSGIVSRHGRSLLLSPEEGWTEKRRVMHALLSGSALKQYGGWQELESTQMVAEYLYQPQRWFAHHYRYANSVVHRIALGERLHKSSQELADLQDVVTRFVGSIGTSWIDWFPELDHWTPKWVLQPWRRSWEKLGQWNYEVYRSWWVPVRRQVDAGTAPPSFVRDVLLHEDTKFTGDDQEAMYVAMQLIEAGSDTTREVLNTFAMAALCYPDKFQKAREEVDRICVDRENGTLRLPCLADMESMPYVCGVIKELLRWRPIFVFTPDHCLTADLEFEGYSFPAGVGFVINEVPVGNECEDPEEFKPERWLDGHEADVAHGLWQFGGGRRICVGYRLAQRGLFINIARLAMCFDYAAAGPINSRKLNHHLTTEPFPVKVTVRSSQHAQLIEEEAAREGVLATARGK